MLTGRVTNLGWPQHVFVCQDWETATGIARAFSIGKAESQALFQLLNEVPKPVAARLESMVKIRGMARFLNHDVIGRQTFSVGWTSGTGPTEGWADILTNRKDNNELVTGLQQDQENF